MDFLRSHQSWLVGICVIGAKDWGDETENQTDLH
jgi:hypothetical protein